MSTVKISQLPVFSIINANTANTLFVGVDIPTDTTFQMTATTLAQTLYSNNILNVGINQQNLPNTIAQFSLSGNSYIQTNLVNTNDSGTADIVVTANTNSGGTDSTNFIDMGYANKNYQAGIAFNDIGNAVNPLDGYLYVQGGAYSNGGNLIVGTTTSNTNLKFIVGGGTAANIVAFMTNNSITLNTGTSIVFADGTKQFTSGASNAYAQAAYSQANAISSYANTQIAYITGINAYQNTIDQIQTANIAAAFNTANSAQANTIYTQGVDVTQNASIAAVNIYSISAYSTANSAQANTIITQGIDVTQNTNIAAINTYSISAYSVANSAQSNTVYTQGVDATQNTNISLLQSAMTTANANIVTLFANASANVTYQSGLNATQNTIIQSAYNQANLANSIANTAIQNTANIILPGNVTFNGANTYFNSNIITYGTMTTTGNVVTTGNLTATGPVIFNGLFTNNGNTINNGNMTTNGNVASFGYLTANGSSTFNGNTSFNGYVTVTNNLSVNNVFTILVPTSTLSMNGSISMTGSITMNNSTFAANSFGVGIIGSSGGATQPPVADGTMLQITGKDGISSKIINDAAGTGAYALFNGRAMRGLASSPSALLAGDVLSRFGGVGYGATGFGSVSSQGGGNMSYVAAENFTDTQKGTNIVFGTTPTGSNTISTALTLTGNTAVFANNVTIANTTNANIINVNTITVSGTDSANNFVAANVFQYNASINNVAVTQLTNKSTAVYANGRTGQITTSNALLNKGVAVQFTVYNNYIVSNKDVVIINLASGASVGYNIGINSVSPGSFVVNVHNADGTPSGSNQSDALVLNFAVLRVA